MKSLIFLHKRLYIPTSFLKIICALHRQCFLKHPFFSTFSVFITVSEVCTISNKYWLPNKSATKYFFTEHITPVFHFQKKVALSIAKDFINIHFLRHTYYLSQWMRYSIFQKNTNLLVIYQINDIFTQDTLYPSFISKKKLTLSIANGFQNTHVLPHFHYF